MNQNILLGATMASLMLVTACSEPAAPPADNTLADADASTGTETAPAETDVPALPELTELSDVLAGEWREADAARDAARHPAETLEFFGIDPSGTVIEIWPGSGWYTDILAPWIAANGGQYVAAHFPLSSENAARRNSRAAFENHVSDHAIYGNVRMVDFGQRSNALVEPGTADAVLTFRNVHNWMMFGYAERAFDDFYAALRPGGVLGVVDHRLPSTREQDPQARSGYVQQAYVIAMAEEAGFELVGTSEINANPADTADHPFGVWTLPPVRRSAAGGEEMAADFDRAGYDAIGESDRMTLLFRKPAADDAAAASEDDGE
ncbi:class I SAM-dependent methyltransferase [Maricaulis sp.]|uniref:class I SAM-dependent methyltransferase n=1 Tax=Maricaulis sp. TaxID=1486257 RepID=UPI003A8EEE99